MHILVVCLVQQLLQHLFLNATKDHLFLFCIFDFLCYTWLLSYNMNERIGISKLPSSESWLVRLSQR